MMIGLSFFSFLFFSFLFFSFLFFLRWRSAPRALAATAMGTAPPHGVDESKHIPLTLQSPYSTIPREYSPFTIQSLNNPFAPHRHGHGQCLLRGHHHHGPARGGRGQPVAPAQAKHLRTRQPTTTIGQRANGHRVTALEARQGGVRPAVRRGGAAGLALRATAVRGTPYAATVRGFKRAQYVGAAVVPRLRPR
jgi:hypothetical protein